MIESPVIFILKTKKLLDRPLSDFLGKPELKKCIQNLFFVKLELFSANILKSFYQLVCNYWELCHFYFQN